MMWFIGIIALLFGGGAAYAYNFSKNRRELLRSGEYPLEDMIEQHEDEEQEEEMDDMLFEDDFDNDLDDDFDDQDEYDE